MLINCQCLDGLVITNYISIFSDSYLDWDNLFNILVKSSPTSLFKFKFHFSRFSEPKSESLKLFFDSWKGRHPMFLQTISMDGTAIKGCFDLIKKYKTDGIIKKYDNDDYGTNFEQFEWIEEKDCDLK